MQQVHGVESLPLTITPSSIERVKKMILKTSDTFRFVKDKIVEGSKGTVDPLRAYARASSGNTFSSFTPEEY